MWQVALLALLLSTAKPIYVNCSSTMGDWIDARTGLVVRIPGANYVPDPTEDQQVCSASIHYIWFRHCADSLLNAVWTVDVAAPLIKYNPHWTLMICSRRGAFWLGLVKHFETSSLE
jgi:hypothetical protein